MVKLDEVLTRTTTGGNPLMNEQLTFGEYWMSVQCSYMHYCTPRETTSISDYTHFEVIMEVPKELITEEWAQYSNGGWLYRFVPKSLIEELIVKMKQKVRV